MHFLIVVSTVVLLVPLNMILFYSFVIQLIRLSTNFKLRSIMYAFFLAFISILVSYLIFEILTTQSISTETKEFV